MTQTVHRRADARLPAGARPQKPVALRREQPFKGTSNYSKKRPASSKICKRSKRPDWQYAGFSECPIGNAWHTSRHPAPYRLRNAAPVGRSVILASLVLCDSYSPRATVQPAYCCPVKCKTERERVVDSATALSKVRRLRHSSGERFTLINDPIRSQRRTGLSWRAAGSMTYPGMDPQ